jgi:hypothetical protein
LFQLANSQLIFFQLRIQKVNGNFKVFQAIMNTSILVKWTSSIYFLQNYKNNLLGSNCITKINYTSITRWKFTFVSYTFRGCLGFCRYNWPLNIKLIGETICQVKRVNFNPKFQNFTVKPQKLIFTKNRFSLFKKKQDQNWHMR